MDGLWSVWVIDTCRRGGERLRTLWLLTCFCSILREVRMYPGRADMTLSWGGQWGVIRYGSEMHTVLRTVPSWPAVGW
jgi:hypothetical protein